MVTEDYVSFETAKLLKEKGFNEKTYRCYNLCTEEHELSDVDDRAYNNWELADDGAAAPTLQMAMKWLREERNLYIQPQILNDGTYIAYIYRTDGFGLVGHDKRRVRNNPEEACEAAIKYCLENLI